METTILLPKITGFQKEGGGFVGQEAIFQITNVETSLLTEILKKTKPTSSSSASKAPVLAMPEKGTPSMITFTS